MIESLKAFRRLSRLGLSLALAMLGLAALSFVTRARPGEPPASRQALAKSCTTPVSSDITFSTTWTFASSPYCLSTQVRIAPGITLTIEPGVSAYFTTQESGLTVEGSLIAIGTPTEPITFTSYQTNPQPGDWLGISILSGSSTKLEYSDISYAGFAEAGGSTLSSCEPGSYQQVDTAGLRVEHVGPNEPPLVEIRHSRVHHNQGNGLYFLATDCPGCHSQSGWTATIQDTQIDHNTGVAICEDMQADGLYIPPAYQDLTLTGNGTDALVFPETMNLYTDITFDGPGSFNGKPIRSLWQSIRNTPGHTLTIAPGTILQFLDSSLDNQGTLNAVGTPTQPITFTSAAPVPQAGDWRGISVIAYLGGPAKLDYCDISYAQRGIDADTNDLTLTHSHIHDNQTGVWTWYASPTLFANRIEANQDYGLVSNYNTLSVNARYNYWGHPSGPYHPQLNPSGLGNQISDHALFYPWNTSPAGSPPSIQVIAPGSGATLSSLPTRFQLRASDPDEGQALYFRVEIFAGYAPIRDYDQTLDPTGWDRAIYTPSDTGVVTATLAVPEALANGDYTWRASVFDGTHTATTPLQPLRVSLGGWDVAGAVPADLLAIPAKAQNILLNGMGFTSGAQVWLEQERYDGSLTRLDPINLQVISSKQISFSADFIGSSGPWDVVVSQDGQTRRTRIFVMPYIALTSLDYQNPQDMVMNHIERHYLHLTNQGTAAGVAVVGINVPGGTQVLSELLDPNQVEYLGQVVDDVHILAVPLQAQESLDVPVYFQLPQSAVNLPGDPVDPSKHNMGEEMRIRFWVLAQPTTQGWQVLRDETTNLQDLLNGAIWGSALIEGWAIDQYAELADEAVAGEYIERLGALYPFVADALVMRQMQDFQLLANLLLEVGDEPSSLSSQVPSSMAPASDHAPLNSDFGDWIRRQIGDPWSFTKGFLLQADENGIPWSPSQTGYERGTFLVAEGEGLVDGLTFGLYKPAFGYWNYYHINGDEQGLIQIGETMGNFLSLPVGYVLPGEFSKGGISLIRKAANGLRPGGDRYWSIFKLTVEGNSREPARLGLSVIWKGGDELATMWKGGEYNLIHWGDSPFFGGSHWGIGWSSAPVEINGVVQRGGLGEVLYNSGPHIYTNHSYIPYRWKGVPFGEVDLRLLRGEINMMYQVPAAAWRAGMIEESARYPAEYVDESACGDGSVRLAFSWDPNDIQGLPRRTHIWPSQPLEFLIRFENLITATLPAETITVTLQVDNNLDWDSLQVAGSSHPQALSVKADAANRQLIWTFQGIDLPPNANPPEGEGWVRLRVRPRADLKTGDQITAQAGIVFDLNPPIRTNVLTYTIDLDPPLASIALDGYLDGWPRVRLSAQDNPAGAGVANVAIYYSSDNVNWFKGSVLNNPTPGETFSGVISFTPFGGRYWLRSAAADLANNIGPMSAESIEVEAPYRLLIPLLSRN